MSVSVVLRTPSLQLGAASQNPSGHSSLRQSAAEVQALPAGHASQKVPPQSTSTSSPLRMPSEHDAAAPQTLPLKKSQKSETQSSSN